MSDWVPGHPDVKMRRVARDEDLLEPGDFHFSIVREGRTVLVTELVEGTIYLTFRNNRGRIISVPVTGSQGWSWDKNFDAPTVSPSILSWSNDSKGKRHTHWHGFIRGGIVGFET